MQRFFFTFFSFFWFCDATFFHSDYVIKPPQPSSANYGAQPFTSNPKPLVSSRMGPWQKREDVCPQKNHLISRRQQQLSQRFQKNAKQCFFHANAIKKGQKMPNTIFSSQTILKRAKFQEFGLKNANLATLMKIPNLRGRLC